LITILQSESTASNRRIPFVCKAMSNLLPDDATGLTFSAAEIQVSKNGATSVNSAGSVVEIGGGVYYYQCTSGEVDTIGFLTIHVVKADYTGQAIAYIGSASVDVIADRVGPWTGDTDKNSIYGALRAMSNEIDDFACNDLVKDDGDGAGDFISGASLKGLRSINDAGFIALSACEIASASSTTSFVLSATAINGDSVSTITNCYRDCILGFITGANAGMTLPIQSSASNRTITLPANRPAITTPSAGDIVIILRDTSKSLTSGGLDDIWDEPLSAHNTANTAGHYMLSAGSRPRTIYVQAGTQSTLTVNFTGSNNNIKLTAWSAGADGDSITFAATNPGTNNASLSISVSGSAITASLATNGSGTITTSASELVDAINDSISAYALVYAECVESAAGTVAAYSVTSLSGGAASSGSDSNDGLSMVNPKASFSGAVSAASFGDIIHLMPGVHKHTGNTRLPAGVTIQGDGPQITRLRLGANSVDVLGSIFIKPSTANVIKNLYVDGAMCGAAAIYTGTGITPPGTLHLENVHVRARGYGVWAAGGVAGGATIQKQKWTANNCRVKSGISAWAMQGSAAVRHESEAHNCYFEADDAYLGGSESSDTSGNTYALLVADSDGYFSNCTLYAKHHHKNRTAYAVQAGSPTDANRPGLITMTGCRMHSIHTQETSPVRITGVSAASEAVITSANHGLADDTLVWIQGVNGTGAITAVNRSCRVANSTTNTFKVKDPQTGSYISTSGGTYIDGGTFDIRPWDILSKWDGSLITLESCAYSPALVETYYGEVQSITDNIEHKASILQGSETGHIVYAGTRDFEAKAYPRNRGWSARHPYTTISGAVLEATAGTAVYIATPEKPFEITSTVTLPDKIDVHGHKNKTKIIHTGTGGSDTTGIFEVNYRNIIEDLWIDDQSSSGVSGIVGASGSVRLVADHVVSTVDFDGVHISSSTVSVATIENCRIVAGQCGVYSAGASHLTYYVGEHPHIVAQIGLRVTDGGLAIFNDGYINASDTGVDADDASKVKMSGAAVVGTTDDISVDGSGSKVFVPATGYDTANVSETNSGVIVASSADISVTDFWAESLGSYDTNQAGGILASINSKVGTAEISVVSPVATNGTVTVIRGDSYYNSDNRALTFTNNDGTWPTLTGSTITFTASKGTASLSVTGTLVDGTGDSKSFYVELSAANTSSLAKGSWDYQITAVLSNTHSVTLVRGQMFVRD